MITFALKKHRCAYQENTRSVEHKRSWEIVFFQLFLLIDELIYIVQIGCTINSYLCIRS